MIKSAKALNTFGHELFDEVDLCDYLRVFKSADYVNYNALQVVRVHEKLLGWDVVALPKEVDLLTDFARAAIIDPFKLAHWGL